MQATVVSCYYKIPSKQTHETYMKWIENFMSLNFNCVLFVNKESKDILTRLYPQTDKRIYVEYDFEDFYTSKWDWKEEEARDPNPSVGHNALLYQIWNEKIFFVKKAIELNHFQTDKFVWMDIGSFRTKNHLPFLINFPNYDKIQNGVNIVQVANFTPAEYQNLSNVDDRFKYPVLRIGGTFGGDSSSLLKFASIHDGIISEFKNKKCFAGQDQSLYAFAVLRHPELFSTIVNVNKHIDSWFILHYAWS